MKQPPPSSLDPGTTLLPPVLPASAPAALRIEDAARRAQLFDVCHMGLALRAVLGVQLVLSAGIALQAPDAEQWLLQLASASFVSMTAVLAWLVLVCAGKHLLARLGSAGQWLVLAGLGALCATAAWRLLNEASGESGSLFRFGAVALTGAGVASALWMWLHSRQRWQRPAAALAQLVELQSRIRPHFLFNTLNSAIVLVQLDPQRAEKVLEDLAELFRVALSENGAAVSLAEEIELARRYLEIEQIRFGERLRVHWRLDPEADGARVPPLLLQPLVENAVRHGVEPNDDGGEIEVLTRRRGGQVELRVSNSVGPGPSRPGHGLALDNVRERLLLMHDVAAQFELHAEPGRYVVKILLPLQS
ncbi:histidine kinase [Pelomonas sp. APW6]|uniref:Histidine kinase n=1 Tax=Roseateles subflavus TaxID=3053353 RepID=A0ABT7LIQ0_9BURK|nr:histidine kinase [Pelomonas sp. APW6]MDL5032319.1 histidine kinase [Pelomonas sp. APW6]